MAFVTISRNNSYCVPQIPLQRAFRNLTGAIRELRELVVLIFEIP